jgi:hypothetical protein
MSDHVGDCGEINFVHSAQALTTCIQHPGIVTWQILGTNALELGTRILARCWRYSRSMYSNVGISSGDETCFATSCRAYLPLAFSHFGKTTPGRCTCSSGLRLFHG